MANNPRKPYVCEATFLYFIQHLWCEIIHLPYTICFYRTILNTRCILITKGAGKYLVDNEHNKKRAKTIATK